MLLLDNFFTLYFDCSIKRTKNSINSSKTKTSLLSRKAFSSKTPLILSSLLIHQPKTRSHAFYFIFLIYYVQCHRCMFFYKNKDCSDKSAILLQF